MLSRASGKTWIVVMLTVLFVLWPVQSTWGYSKLPKAGPQVSSVEAKERLSGGFRQILKFFEQRDFSLLVAWREMRGSADPDYFERKYPEISKELDSWASTLESQFGVSDATAGGLDFTFLLEELAPLASDPDASEIVRDNAVATVCMVCLMDALRCDRQEFHRFLATVVAEDSSPARKAEAIRWWRRSDGFIDEALLERVLASPAATDLDLRSEIARTLFAIETRRSLQAQRLLASTTGLPQDSSGSQPRIACTAIRHFAQARFEEAAPVLIEALRDPSRDVRACAAESLVTLSGIASAFDASSDVPQNEDAIARWQAWWEARTPAVGAR